MDYNTAYWCFQQYEAMKGSGEGFFNASLNRCHINKPQSCGFYSSDAVEVFFFKEPMRWEFPKKYYYEKFYAFLDSYLLSRIGMNCSDFLNSRVMAWKQQDPAINNDTLMLGYLFRMFVYAPLLGRMKEIDAISSLDTLAKKRGINLSITSSTGIEDSSQCYDFKIVSENSGGGRPKTIFIQVKPVSFHKGLHGNTHFSAVKIKKAAEKFSLPIFIMCYSKNAAPYFLVRNSHICPSYLKKISINKFLDLFSSGVKAGTIIDMAMSSLSLMTGIKKIS